MDASRSLTKSETWPSASTFSGPAAAERVKPDMRLLGLLALGHFVVDTNQGSLPALLPFLRTALDLSYAATGAIVLMANVTSSLTQPLFAYLPDQTTRRW